MGSQQHRLTRCSVRESLGTCGLVLGAQIGRCCRLPAPTSRCPGLCCGTSLHPHCSRGADCRVPTTDEVRDLPTASLPTLLAEPRGPTGEGAPDLICCKSSLRVLTISDLPPQTPSVFHPRPRRFWLPPCLPKGPGLDSLWPQEAHKLCLPPTQEWLLPMFPFIGMLFPKVNFSFQISEKTSVGATVS